MKPRSPLLPSSSSASSRTTVPVVQRAARVRLESPHIIARTRAARTSADRVRAQLGQFGSSQSRLHVCNVAGAQGKPAVTRQWEHIASETRTRGARQMCGVMRAVLCARKCGAIVHGCCDCERACCGVPRATHLRRRRRVAVVHRPSLPPHQYVPVGQNEHRLEMSWASLSAASLHVAMGSRVRMLVLLQHGLALRQQFLVRTQAHMA